MVIYRCVERFYLNTGSLEIKVGLPISVFQTSCRLGGDNYVKSWFSESLDGPNLDLN